MNNSMNMHEQLGNTPVIFHGAIAIFGAVVHALKAHRNGQSKTFLDFVTLTVMSSFSGVMFAILGLQLFPDQIYVTLMLAGAGGFMGVEGMVIIIDVVRNLTTKK